MTGLDHPPEHHGHHNATMNGTALAGNATAAAAAGAVRVLLEAAAR